MNPLRVGFTALEATETEAILSSESEIGSSTLGILVNVGW